MEYIVILLILLVVVLVIFIMGGKLFYFEEEYFTNDDLECKYNKKYKNKTKIDKLLNTTWIVPEETIKMYNFSDNVQIKGITQIVWKINKVDGNYIFGKVYSYLDGEYSSSNLNGSITTSGITNIIFEHKLFTIVGNGIFKGNKFEMQVSNRKEKTVNFMHCSYMINIDENNINYYKLPGTNLFNGVFLSVDEFIEKCDNKE